MILCTRINSSQFHSVFQWNGCARGPGNRWIECCACKLTLVAASHRIPAMKTLLGPVFLLALGSSLFAQVPEGGRGGRGGRGGAGAPAAVPAYQIQSDRTV